MMFTYKVIHHAPQKFQIDNVILLHAHLSQLSRYQLKLSHLIVISLHDVLQLLQLLTAQVANQLLKFLHKGDNSKFIIMRKCQMTFNSSGSRGCCCCGCLT